MRETPGLHKGRETQAAVAAMEMAPLGTLERKGDDACKTF